MAPSTHCINESIDYSHALSLSDIGGVNLFSRFDMFAQNGDCFE